MTRPRRETAEHAVPDEAGARVNDKPGTQLIDLHAAFTALLADPPSALLPSHCCGVQPTHEECGHGHSLYCGSCYDGAEDAGPQNFEHAAWFSDARQRWNERQEENTP
jgi:hypothetical protein